MLYGNLSEPIVAEPTTLVFDTGPVSHFAREGWLGCLKAVVGDRHAVLPDVVVDELRAGAARDARLQAVLDAGWLEPVELTTTAELDWFGQFSSRLVVGSKNVGEAGVLAYARAHDFVAVVDDGPARAVGREFGVVICPTLRLLCQAVQQGLLTPLLVSALADDLLSGAYRLPFPPGEFVRWATDNGLLGGEA